MATKLILIRHDQTTANRQKKYSGFMDVCLNSEGIKQVRKLHKRFKTARVDKVYSSDRKRAVESARIVFQDYSIQVIKDLREMHFGVFEGLTYEQIMEKYPRAFKRWLDNPFKSKIPKGEHLGDFRKRVVRAIERIVFLHPGKTVAVVCHGGTISILLSSILKVNRFWERIPQSASLTIIEYRRRKPRLKVFNDTLHLSK